MPLARSAETMVTSPPVLVMVPPPLAYSPMAPPSPLLNAVTVPPRIVTDELSIERMAAMAERGISAWVVMSISPVAVKFVWVARMPYAGLPMALLMTVPPAIRMSVYSSWMPVAHPPCARISRVPAVMLCLPLVGLVTMPTADPAKVPSGFMAVTRMEASFIARVDAVKRWIPAAPDLSGLLLISCTDISASFIVNVLFLSPYMPFTFREKTSPLWVAETSIFILLLVI